MAKLTPIVTIGAKVGRMARLQYQGVRDVTAETALRNGYDGLIQALGQYIRIRWLLLFGFLLVTFALRLLNARYAQIFAVGHLVLFGMVLNVAFYLWLESRRRLQLLAGVQVVAEIVVITALIYLSGGAQSYLFPLYAVTIITSSILLGRRASLAAAVLSTAAYAGILAGELGGFLPHLPAIFPGGGTVPEPVIDHTWTVGVINGFFQFSVALLSGHLADIAKARQEALERTNARLREQVEINENLLELAIRLKGITGLGQLEEVAAYAARNLLRAESAHLWVRDEAGRGYRPRVSAGSKEELSAFYRYWTVDADEVALAFRDNPLVLLPTGEPGFLPPTYAEMYGPGPHVAVPLRTGDDLYGFVTLNFHGSYQLTETRKALLAGLASQLTVALNHALLFQRVAEKDEARRRLLNRVVSAQEEERKRIARELHDETGQALSALILHLDLVQAALPEEATQARARLAQLHAAADQMLDEIHKLILDLRPSILDDLGLTAAVRWYQKSRLEPAGVAGKFECVGEEYRLPSEMEVALFRIVQESITNALKYAQAKNIDVTMRFEPDRVAVEIRDDGVGFEPSEVARRRGKGAPCFGILGMEERAALFGGSFNVISGPGAGTTVSVSVPVPKRRQRAGRAGGRGPASDRPDGTGVANVADGKD